MNCRRIGKPILMWKGQASFGVTYKHWKDFLNFIASITPKKFNETVQFGGEGGFGGKYESGSQSRNVSFWHWAKYIVEILSNDAFQAQDRKSESKSDKTTEGKIGDEVSITIPPRTKLVVKQRVFDCFDTKDQSKIYQAAGRRITTSFTKLEEPSRFFHPS